MLAIAFNLIIIRLARHRALQQGTSMRVTEIQFQHDTTIKPAGSDDIQSSEPSVC